MSSIEQESINMPWLVNLIMFICVVPSVIILALMAFPKNPEKRKMIFGVRDNPKFHEVDTAKRIKDIAASCRKSGLIITAIVCLLSVVLLIVPYNSVTIIAWMLLVFGLFLVAIPYAKGNQELKNLKKELGITKSGKIYTDLTSTSVVHGLKMPWLILPNAVVLVATVFAVLVDFGVIRITENLACEKYALTIMCLSFMFVGMILIPIAYMMDNVRNTVISKDSNVNANYNRAKKKGWADLMVAMSWANALYTVAYSIISMFVFNEMIVLIGIIAYTVIIMISVAVAVKTQSSIEKRYERDTDLELLDDDDYWILGMFYCNPHDTRLNVEKRFGFGGTVNFAHPAGKVIAVISILLILGALIYLVWAAATGQLSDASINTPFH